MKFNIKIPKIVSYSSALKEAEHRSKQERLWEERAQYEARILEDRNRQEIKAVEDRNQLEIRMLEKKIEDFELKYLEEHIEQLNRMNKTDVVALPSFISNKELGNKELPLYYAVKEAYAINPTVAACINVISQSASLVPFTLRKQGKEGQYSTIFKDPILDLLNNPNQTQTESEFIEHVVMNLLLCGNALVWKNTNQDRKRGENYKPNAPVSELIILNPDHVEYKDNGFEITEYLGKEKSPLAGNTWDPNEIIHFRLTNPLNMFWGLSPIQAAYMAIDLDSKILRWWMETLENGCRKDMLIKFKHELTDLQYKRVTNLIQNQVSGFRNGRSFMILGHEAQVEFLNIAPAELDFTDSRKANSREIMAIFRVPPPLISILDDATPGGSRDLILAFWLNTIMPLLNDLASVLTKRLLPNFGKDINNYFISYDTKEVPALQSLIADTWSIITAQVSVGVPLNIAIKSFRLQLPDIEGGDVGYMSHNLVPMGFYTDPGVAQDPNVTDTAAQGTKPRDPSGILPTKPSDNPADKPKVKPEVNPNTGKPGTMGTGK